MNDKLPAAPKRKLCIPCIVAGFLAVVFLLGIGLAFAVGWGQRSAMEQLANIPAPPPLAAPIAGCSPAQSCCAPITPPFHLDPVLSGWPVMAIFAVAVLFTFVVIAGLIALLLLLGGATPASLTQLGTIVRAAISLLPHMQTFADALRRTADGMWAGHQACEQLRTTLTNAGAALDRASDALGSVPVPGRNWTLDPILEGSPLSYVKLVELPPGGPFDLVVGQLHSTKGQLDTASHNVKALGDALEDASKFLNTAADAIGQITP